MDLFAWADRHEPIQDVPASLPVDGGLDEKASILTPDEAGDELATEPNHPPAPWPNEDQPPDTTMSLADALEQGKASGASASMVREWISAVSRVTKLLGRDAAKLPASPAELGPLMEKVLPARHRMQRKTWSNIRSAIRRMLECVGLHAPKALLRAPLGGSWRDAFATVPHSPQMACVRGLARWCEARGIEPGAVDEGTLADYAAWRRRWTLDHHLESLGSTIRQGWNGAVDTIGGWPRRRLQAAPRIRGRQRYTDRELSSSFVEDKTRYLATMSSPPDPLNPRSGRRLAPMTVRMHDEQLRAAATELARRLGSADRITSLATLVEGENPKTILLAEYDDTTGRWSGQALLRASVLVRMADKHLRWPDTKLKQLRDYQRHINTASGGETRRTGGTPRRRAMLRQFDDPTLVRRFLNLPAELFLEADREANEGRPVRAARLHERALALAILQEFVFRRRNMVELRIGDHLRRDDRGRITALTIDGAETKNGVTLGGAVRPELARRIQRHLAKHRPHLPGHDTEWLFPSASGEGHCSPEGLQVRLRKLVRDRVGILMSVHDHRHVVAKLLAEADANAIPVVQRILGHIDPKTTARMYGQMTTAAAQAEYAELLDGIRKKRARSRRRQKGRLGAKP